jgi:hypothetical protein
MPPDPSGAAENADDGEEPDVQPEQDGPARTSIFDLEMGVNSYGRDIWVEERDENTRRPNVWYQKDRHGKIKRFKRGLFSVNVERVEWVV